MDAPVYMADPREITERLWEACIIAAVQSSMQSHPRRGESKVWVDMSVAVPIICARAPTLFSEHVRFSMLYPKRSFTRLTQAERVYYSPLYLPQSGM